MLFLILPLACGQYVDAADVAAIAGECDDFTAEVDLQTREELATATRLGHYGLTGLLTTHTGDETWAGGTVRSVDYSGMLANLDSGVTIGDTVANLGAIDPLALESHEESLAFWMNLYNAWALQGAHSQLSADPGWEGAAASTWNGEETGTAWVMFSTRFVLVGGVQLTLDEVEHGVLRGDYDPADYADEPELLALLDGWHASVWDGGAPDARLHMGINCVSRSCPDVPGVAFTADNVYDLLDDNAVRFANHPGKGAGPDGISSLFSWFRSDFEGTFGGVEAFVQRYREGGDSDVNYDRSLEYSWELNGS